VWWVFNHRAFLEAMCIGNILREQAALDIPGGSRDGAIEKDSVYVKGREDVGMCFSRPLLFLAIPKG